MSDPGILLAIDGNSLAHRAFHAQAATGLRTAAGEPIWAVRGLLSQIVAAVERIGPDRVVIGFDDPRRSERRDRWPQYKANRGEKLETLVSQLELARITLAELGFAVVVPPGLEADDVLASAAAQNARRGGRTVVVTSDRDAFSLIDDRTRVLRIINGGVEASPLLTPDRLRIMLGVGPEQYRDYAALRGDSSDNLPGVRGFGPKTAARLLSALGTAGAAFDDAADGGARVREALGAALVARLAEPGSRAIWELNCAVMAQRDDVDLGLDGAAGALPLDVDAVRAAFAQFQLPFGARAALRALAHVEDPGPGAHHVAAAAPSHGVAPGSRRPWPPRAQPSQPRLPAPQPVLAQLSLFD